MNTQDEKSNLSNIRIYDLLKVKNPKKFHINEAKKKIAEAIDSIRTAQIDLSSIQFPKNKRINRAIVKELSQQLHNTNWFLLSLLEAISTYQNIKQNQNWLTNGDLNKLLESLRNPGEIL